VEDAFQNANSSRQFGIFRGSNHKVTLQSRKRMDDEEVETVVEFYKQKEFLGNRHLLHNTDRQKRTMAIDGLEE
jgi:hypothetical protein